MRKYLLPLLLVLPLATTVAACGDDEGNPNALTVYSGRNEDLVGPLLERFEKESGVDLEVRYADTAELAATIREEGANSPADVFFGQDAGALGALAKEQLTAPLAQSQLGKVDERFRSPAGAWVGTSARARVIAYDSREYQDADLPQSVFDLTQPAWKGKVGWAPTNGSFQAFVTAMRKIAGEDRAKAWLEGMRANGVKTFDSNIAIRDAIAAGEIDLGLINHYYVLEAKAQEGDDYPVDVHFTKAGDPGSLVNVAGVAVLKSSEKQADAAKLVDFLLATEAQKFFAEETKEYPVADGVAGPAGVPPLADLEQPDIDLSDLDDLAGTLELIESSGAL
ncbi:extracellular solute-binding protein [Conexibacter sp. W3-3-2]|uniref:iron ABC transporter substrate-binding protein n=1 Tax=Conexibacter sp. W3-3-2 TaxID=2675227 RepID=UPI0012B8CED5|nr:iron ABC transporter substrate-binding protein [Conexibacter sp. W3-3-2]MTD44513.1 extracellular solute-binding protein [Conexibacter sp. W3-3-2]